jgi:hypothetical protein
MIQDAVPIGEQLSPMGLDWDLLAFARARAFVAELL